MGPDTPVGKFPYTPARGVTPQGDTHLIGVRVTCQSESEDLGFRQKQIISLSGVLPLLHTLTLAHCSGVKQTAEKISPADSRVTLLRANIPSSEGFREPAKCGGRCWLRGCWCTFPISTLTMTPLGASA